MNFKKKPISSDKYTHFKNFFKKIKKPSQYSPINLAFFSFVITLLVITIGWSLVAVSKNIKITKFIPSFLTKEILSDDHNHTNILLLGIGGEQHDGSNLTDTMIVVSLDHNDHYVGMLSLPRDLWVKTKVGDGRINNIYEFASQKYGNSAEGLNFLKNTISDIVGMPIHYYVKVDFQGFVEAVNAVGGLDVNLDKPFYDPLYPKGETIYYETFSLPAGPNHLDGATALKYVRSRHSTSDFDRSLRQQQVIHLLKSKALSLKILGNPRRLKNLYDSLSNNLETNLKWSEMLYVSKIADQFSSDQLASSVINDNPVGVGGFLYVPERKYYGGAYVLVPQTNDWREIQDFATFILRYPRLFKIRDEFPLQILNGSGGRSLATATKRMLTRYGYNVVRFGNGKSQKITDTKIYFHDIRPDLMTVLNILIPGQTSAEIPLEYQSPPYLSEASILIELGRDYLQYYKENVKRFNY